MKNKKILMTFLLFFLIVIYVYVLAIDAIPKSIILFQGENLNLRKIIGISMVNKETGDKAVLTSTDLEEEKNIEKIGTKKIEVKLFNTFSVKDIDISVIERTKIVPIGQIAGLKLYTSGVLVVGMSEVKGMDNERHKPYENSGIQEGDTIIQIQGIEITDTKQLIGVVNSSKGNDLKIKYVRDGKALECSITPIQTTKTEYKLGLWVRDSAAGIGTMTYYEPSTGNFAALRTWNYRYRYRKTFKYFRRRIYNYKSIVNSKRKRWKSWKNSGFN